MSLLEFLESHYEVRRTRNPEEVLICCPSCNDTKFHGGFNIKKRVYGCFKCGSGLHRPKGLSAWNFLKRFHSLTHSQIREILDSKEDLYSWSSSYTDSDKEETILSPPAHTRELTPKDTSILGTSAWEYVYGRFEDETRYKVDLYNLSYAILPSRFFGRIVIPCYDREGNLIHLQGRSFLPELSPPYLNVASCDKPLFGTNILPEEGAEIYLVEGAFDAMAIGVGGVCIYGRTMTPGQVRELLKLKPSRVTVALDPDTAGKEGAKQLLRMLYSYNGVFVSYDLLHARGLPSDPGDLRGSAKSTIDSLSRPYRSLV